MRERILRVWDTGGRSIKVEQAEFIDGGSQNRDSSLHVEMKGVRKGSDGLFGWLKPRPKEGPQGGK